jgi:hypothetical protein
VSWGAQGRALEAATRVVNNPVARRPRAMHPHHAADPVATQPGCLWCDINALRAALLDARMPGVGGDPGHPSPPAALPPSPPERSNAGGDSTVRDAGASAMGTSASAPDGSVGGRGGPAPPTPDPERST